MKLYKIFAIMLAGATLASCNDFLDREPKDFGDENSYYKSANDLCIAVNKFYEFLPKNAELWGGIYSEDNNSDNQAAGGANALFYRGNKLTPKMGKNTSQWNFENLRGINFFINKAEDRLAAGEISGNENLINHYLGEGYFFRAYDYFRLLCNYGDVPILTKMMPDDLTELVEASKRMPRNEVARFILSDLDRAAELLQNTAPESGRVYRDVALAFKARVALYEASWERYHAGTCFVPGNDKWVGKSYWPEFKFVAGSPEAEVNFFLEEAIKSAGEVADAYTLSSDYAGMFNRWDSDFPTGHEVIFARYYKSGVLSHSCSSYLSGGGNCNATRAAVDSYLMTNGLPIYANGSKYQGDEIGYYQFQNRDERLSASVRAPGSILEPYVGEDGRTHNDTIYYHRPNILNTGNEKATTGFEINKYVSSDRTQKTQYMCTTAVPLIRAAECYLVYMEAYYMRYGQLDAKAAGYWKSLRKRAGVDEDFNKTIAATDLDKENDLAVWSKGEKVDATLYNIRRERRCEFFAEGMRLDDLKRWRSLDMMIDYQPEGINLWDKQWEMWGQAIRSSTAVSPSSVSKYIRPLQRSAGANAYEGYNFPKPHYLEPIPLSEFKFGESPNLYQNPGWPSAADGPADYSYDCD